MDELVTLEITLAGLPADILGAQRAETAGPAVLRPGFNLENHLDQVAKTYLQEAGTAAGGNMRRMAELLGLSYRSLRYLLDKYQIKSFRRSESREERTSSRTIV